MRTVRNVGSNCLLINATRYRLVPETTSPVTSSVAQCTRVGVRDAQFALSQCRSTRRRSSRHARLTCPLACRLTPRQHREDSGKTQEKPRENSGKNRLSCKTPLYTLSSVQHGAARPRGHWWRRPVRALARRPSRTGKYDTPSAMYLPLVSPSHLDVWTDCLREGHVP
jgi:hypothetical protein